MCMERNGQNLLRSQKFGNKIRQRRRLFGGNLVHKFFFSLHSSHRVFNLQFFFLFNDERRSVSNKRVAAVNASMYTGLDRHGGFLEPPTAKNSRSRKKKSLNLMYKQKKMRRPRRAGIYSERGCDQLGPDAVFITIHAFIIIIITTLSPFVVFVIAVTGLVKRVIVTLLFVVVLIVGAVVTVVPVVTRG